MDKHKTRNNNSVVPPKLIRSMTTKGQMKPTFTVSLNVSQACDNSQSNVPEHTVRTLADLIFRRNHRRRAACLAHLSGCRCEVAEFKQRVSKFKINTKNHELQHKFLIYEFLGLKTK